MTTPRMLRRSLFTGALLLIFLAGPGMAQLQYFGYVGSAETAVSLDRTHGFTNFAHVATDENLYSSALGQKVIASSQRGLKVTIDLGKVLWCGSDYRNLCWDYIDRWNTWKQHNASILTSDKVLGFAVRDEPFLNGVNMSHYEAAVARVKGDFPWAKMWMVEAACAVRGFCNGAPSPYFSSYFGTLPGIDWVGLDEYGVHPATDSGYQSALQSLKQRFPGRKGVYVMDAYSSIGPTVATAREWYDVARSDPDAIILGVFSWDGAESYACNVLLEHERIGREITGKGGISSPPIGYFELSSSLGAAVGWTCDPNGTVCGPPRVDFHADGSYFSTATYMLPLTTFTKPQCGNSLAYRFQMNLAIGVMGKRLTAYAHDAVSASAPLPPVQLSSGCPDNPACYFYNSDYAPIGWFEGISPTGVARGWTCDQDAPDVSLRIHFYTSSSQFIGSYTANLASEAAVNDECGGGTAHRFSVQLPSWIKGQYIVVYGIDTMQGSSFLPATAEAGCPYVGYCTW